ncbi:hypothetical protein AB0H57_10730 [Micromonospora sp. NPDC050686]|uniref:hypothetical protein n=1 Tax=Micromonospora sp. NPDC050686 TaxID=3154631 RepID=UPI0033F57201
MTAAKRSSSARTGASKPANKTPVWKQALLWVGLLGAVAACTLGSLFGSDSDTAVPAPAADERAGTVPLLVRAADSQGICYGWRLGEGYGVEPVDVGSNLGAGVAVAQNPTCPRWLQVEAQIHYTSASSESEDSAAVRVTGSPDVSAASLSGVRQGLERLGLTEDVFVDDPGWAVTRAAVMLPLLAAEAGLADPAPTPSAAASAPPLPAAGNDFLRDRWGWLLAAFGLLLVTALLLTVGVVQRRRTTAPGRGAAPDAPSRSGRKLRGAAPGQRAGAGTAGPRTRGPA